MAVVDTQTLAIEADTWTEVAEGPLEVNLTGHEENFDWALSAAEPGATVHGHFRRANEDLIVVVETDVSLWVRNRLSAFRVSYTLADVE